MFGRFESSRLYGLLDLLILLYFFSGSLVSGRRGTREGGRRT